MAKHGEVMLSQIGSHPWGSLSVEVHLGCEDYIRSILSRFSKSDEKEIQWMIDKGVLNLARLKQIIGCMLQDTMVPAQTRFTILSARLTNILEKFVPAGNVFTPGAEEKYFRFTIVPKGNKFLAFVQGEEMYGETVMHGVGDSEFEALKSLVSKVEILAPQK